MRKNLLIQVLLNMSVLFFLVYKQSSHFLKKTFEAVAFSDVSNYATEYKAGDYWLGGYFDKGNKTWSWMDDSEVHFDIWGQ